MPARPLALALALALTLAGSGCRPDVPAPLSTADTAAIGDTLRALIERTYDFSRPDVVARLMSLYPDTGPVISAASGQALTERDSLREQIASFWEYVGQNMQDPRWEWTETHVTVLAPDAAVLTGVYRIPHLNPSGQPHTVGGAWTMVFRRIDGRWTIVQEHLSDRPQERGEGIGDRG
ncbi:MAG TPA: DUF4440 domain-containing protein [Gemmatimonadaceae bacterium]|nr:DUF4440 domain-containing protein [Gemmatimonadaceae bacterium]